jgi:hypothetical protein
MKDYSKGLEIENAFVSLEDHRQKLIENHYRFISGGQYDCQWGYWVHEDFYELAKKCARYACLDEDAMAKELGIEELPEGAVVDSALNLGSDWL